MIQSLLLMTLTMSLMFTFMSHPLSMGFILLIQATLISMITGLMSHNFWFSYILFMIMIGGMLVLFIYMTSVASNEKFLYSNKLTIIMGTTLTIMFISMFTDSFFNYETSTHMDTTMTETPMFMFSMSLSKYLNTPSSLIMITMILYLLVALIAVVKITNIKYGPLRQKF